MAEGNPKDVFQSVIELSRNDQIREALNPIKCLTESAQMRAQADRVGAAARELAGGEKEVSAVTGALAGVKPMFKPMDAGYREISRMLAGVANKELALVFNLAMPADEQHGRAHFWRTRVLCDLLAASTYYKVGAELISLAMKTLSRCNPSMKAPETALLLHHAAALLVDAGKFMGTAGAELGDNEAHWRNLEESVRSL